MKKHTYLTITAHPDDEVLGFGGSCYALASKGHTVVNGILSGQVAVRAHRPSDKELAEDIKKAEQYIKASRTILGNFPNIAFNTVPHIELVQFIERIIVEVQPDYIFTHYPHDLNNDHFHTSIACQAAARLFQRREEVKYAAPAKGLCLLRVGYPEFPFPPEVWFDTQPKFSFG